MNNQNFFEKLEAEVQRQSLKVRNVLVHQHGQLLARRDFAGDTPHNLWSGSKTFTGMAVGLAASEGRLSLTDSMTGFFREMGYAPDASFDKIQVRDLLRMSSGHGFCPLNRAMEQGEPLSDLCALFFDTPLKGAPGERFVYNNTATYMLSRIVEQVSGEDLLTYLTSRLFVPMAITPQQWDRCPMGHPQGFAGLWLTASDYAKMGQLLLSGGRWKDHQLVPEPYVREATAVQISTADFDAPFATADHLQGYGYQLWHCSYPGSYRLDGMFGQYCAVLPDRDAVVTFISDEPEKITAILELIWNTLLDRL